MTTLPSSRLWSLAAAGTLALAVSAEAQERSVTWTETTRVETAGTLGTVLQALPGGLSSRHSEHGIHLMGGKLRQDGGSTSMIIDLDARRWTSLDHEERAYTSMSFAESAEMISAMATGAVGEMGDERAEMEAALAEIDEERDELMAEMREVMDEISDDLSFDVEVRPTGETREFGGFSANRYLIVAQVAAPDGVEGVEEGGAGGLAFVVERWQSEAFPSGDAVYEAWAQEMATDPAMNALAEQMAGSLEPVASQFQPEMMAQWDPRIASGLERLAEVSETLGGVSLQTTTTIAFVPSGIPLDTDGLLAWRPETVGERARGEAGERARGAARSALRGLTGGLLGGEDEEDEAVEEAAVQPLLRIVREVGEINDHGAPTPSLFEISPDYRERPLPTWDP